MDFIFGIITISVLMGASFILTRCICLTSASNKKYIILPETEYNLLINNTKYIQLPPAYDSIEPVAAMCTGAQYSPAAAAAAATVINTPSHNA